MQTTELTSKFHFHLWLQNQFTERTRKNPRYSVRAFAKLLQMEPSTISQLLSGKRRASTKVLTQICERLSVRPEIRQLILKASLRSKTDLNRPETGSPYLQLAADSFAVMADWYHYAILELTFTQEFQSQPEWIAEQLGLNVVEAKAAISRLLRLDLLTIRDGELTKTKTFLTNYSEGFTAPALKELQRQILGQALSAIEHISQDEKDITSMTMAIDPAKLPEAKKRIRKFRRELCAYLTQDNQSQVYNLGIQLFPISKRSEGASQ